MTQTTLEDVLDPLINENANRDVAEVINYIKATEFAIARLKGLPLCNRLIKETYDVLMENSHGQEKNPGGNDKGHIRDLEKHINHDELDILILVALIHYQFETIYPFLDGNGYVGACLSPCI